MAISSEQVDSKPDNRELYAYNPQNRFKIYERNINNLIYYKFFPDIFKDKIIEQIKKLPFPIEVIENSNGWLRIVVPEEHKDDEAVQQIASNVGDGDLDDYYAKKSKLYASKGWQVIVSKI